jgi:hypothetical protein
VQTVEATNTMLKNVLIGEETKSINSLKMYEQNLQEMLDSTINRGKVITVSETLFNSTKITTINNYQVMLVALETILEPFKKKEVRLTGVNPGTMTD